jgi:hypothetical protein
MVGDRKPVLSYHTPRRTAWYRTPGVVSVACFGASMFCILSTFAMTFWRMPIVEYAALIFLIPIAAAVSVVGALAGLLDVRAHRSKLALLGLLLNGLLAASLLVLIGLAIR